MIAFEQNQRTVGAFGIGERSVFATDGSVGVWGG